MKRGKGARNGSGPKGRARCFEGYAERAPGWEGRGPPIPFHPAGRKATVSLLGMCIKNPIPKIFSNFSHPTLYIIDYPLRKQGGFMLKDKIDVISSQYFDEYRNLREIGALHGVSGMAIQQVLKKAGFDTSKRRYVVACAHCSSPIAMTRKKIRSACWGRFCSVEHYQAWRRRHPTERSRLAPLEDSPLTPV